MNNSAALNCISAGCALIALLAIIFYPYNPTISTYLALAGMLVLSVIPAILASQFNRAIKDIENLQDRREESNWRETDRIREQIGELSNAVESKRK